MQPGVTAAADEAVLDLGVVEQPVLFFGGPYSNLEATTALLEAARDLGVPPERTICTGDVVAYCADPAATVAAVREAGVHVVMGNCEESLGFDAEDCGCGFAEGSACDVLSRQWFAHAQASLDADARAWMRGLPRRIEMTAAGARLVVVHGSAREIAGFVFASSPGEAKAADLNRLAADVVVGGHAGLPFTSPVGRRLWHNAGVIGMPANDGTPRGWFTLMRPEEDGLAFECRALDYDFRAAAARMREIGLSAGYAEALESGLWPSEDVLPGRERAARGQPLAEHAVRWRSPAAAAVG